MKKTKTLILITFLSILTAVACACGQSKNEVVVSTKEDAKGESETGISGEETIQVFVCGEVKKPGVYRVKKDDRIVAAIEAAGGLTRDAAYDSVNQAQKMEDGQQIYIPSKTDQQSTLTQKSDESSSDLISINQASKEELMTLPGIGESKADRILAYRQEHGGFKSLEELMNISGIKEGVYNKMKDYITL